MTGIVTATDMESDQGRPAHAGAGTDSDARGVPVSSLPEEDSPHLNDATTNITSPKADSGGAMHKDSGQAQAPLGAYETMR